MVGCCSYMRIRIDRTLAAVLSVAIIGVLAMPARAAESHQASPTQATAVFAGGCFWGVDGVFKHVRGVTGVVSGYAGGSIADPSYEQVSTGTTGYAESVKVSYDPAKVSYRDLLKVFFTIAHDPTELNRQGPDEGTQYRSAIFYSDAAQKKAAEDYVAELNREKAFSEPIVTQVVPLKSFYPAEAYHQNFLELHPDYPYIVYNDLPKVTNLREKLPDLYCKTPAGLPASETASEHPAN